MIAVFIAIEFTFFKALVCFNHEQNYPNYVDIVWQVLFSASYDNTIKQWNEESDDWFLKIYLFSFFKTTLFLQIPPLHPSRPLSKHIMTSKVLLLSSLPPPQQAYYD
jgi:hypothetical protein